MATSVKANLKAITTSADGAADTAQRLRELVDGIKMLRSEVKELNADIAGVYERAKQSGYDTKALKALVKRLESDPGELEAHEALVALYEAQYSQFNLDLAQPDAARQSA